MQRRAVFRHVEIGIAIVGHGVHIDAKIEQLPNAIRVPDTRELREQFASLRHQFAHQLRVFSRDGTHGG